MKKIERKDYWDVVSEKEARHRYAVYLRDYVKQRDKMQALGETMAEKPYNYAMYKEEWLKKRRDLEHAKDIGERNSIGNVNQYLVREQAYELSQKAGKALYKALEARGELEDFGLTEARYNKNGELVFSSKDLRVLRQGELARSQAWWDAIANERERLKSLGYDKKAISHEISKTFYGSK